MPGISESMTSMNPRFSSAVRLWKISLVIAFILFGVNPASARQDLIAPPSGLWVTPAAKGGKLYGPSSEDANWHVTQWRSAGTMSGFDGRGTASSSSQRIRLGDHGYELEADGKSVACDHEFDTFVGANNNQGMFKGYPSAVSADRRLSDMTALMHTIALHPISEIAGERNCRQQKAIHVTAISLRNDLTKSTLFYQLRLRTFQTELKPFWWDKGEDGKRYGFGDNLASFGLTDVPLGKRQVVTVDLLPRIKQLLADERVAIDRDLSHWRVGTAYHGVAIWGNVKVKARWDGFSLYAEP
jgi:hypothetical protein